jgi:hypothetical protein
MSTLLSPARARVVAISCLLAVGVLGACGGQELGSSSGTKGSGGSGGSTSGSDGGSCVDIVLSTYSRSCNKPSDCILITAGEVCDGDCSCDGSPVSASEESRYDSAIASIHLGGCFCSKAPVPECIDHTCTLAGESDAGGPSDGSVSIEASSTCVDIDLSTYDTSCNVPSDCIQITSGEICPDTCECGGSSINKSGSARYEKAISGVTTTPCHCASQGSPTCVTGLCVVCGGPSPSPYCPLDAG